MLKKRFLAVLMVMTLAMTAFAGCNKRQQDPDVSKSSEDLFEETESEEEYEVDDGDRKLVESIMTDQIKTDFDDAETIDSKDVAERNDDSATVREDGSVVVEGKDKDGNTIVLIYKDEESYTNNEQAAVAPKEEVENATVEIEVQTKPSTSASTEKKSESSKESSTAATTKATETTKAEEKTEAPTTATPTTSATKPVETTQAPTKPVETTQPPTTVATTEAPTTEAPTTAYDEFANTTAEQVRAWILESYQQYREGMGLARVPEDAQLNAQCAALVAINMENNSIGHSSRYVETMDHCLVFNSETCYVIEKDSEMGDHGMFSGTTSVQGNALFVGGEANYVHSNGNMYTAEIIGVGIAVKKNSHAFYVTIETRVQ